jgi:preprotein translocase subunit SecD
MLTISRWKMWSVLGVCFLGLLFSAPNVLSPETLQRLPFWLQKTINLGLELRGGSHLQLEVDLKTVSKDYLSNLLDEARSRLRAQQIGYSGLLVDAKGVQPSLTFSLRAAEDAEKAKKILHDVDQGLDIHMDGLQLTASISEKTAELRTKQIIEQSIEVVRRRVDESGTKEPTIQRQGTDRIILQLPGVEDPGEVKRLIGKTAKMSFRLVDASVPPIPGTLENPPRIAPPSGSDYLAEVMRDGQVVYIAVKKQVMVSGETLIDAQATFGEYGQTAVSLKFNSLGAKKFADMSRDYLKKQFAIVLDDKVISAPVFQSVIPDGSGQITGSFTVKEANELATILRAGALPAPLKVIEERTVGPSLGADSIKDGQKATILAFIMVSVFMIASYATFGLFADIALIFNLILLFAGLSVLQATLTLPGIAGIALTIGMAVDANVLIYERIKEEIRAGMKPINAIDSGYKRAMTTILDSNFTTLLGAAILFEFGTGPIRGFAVTLALGILISLFTALSLTRLIIMFWLGRRKVATLPI